jgi:hypothetical protein
MQQLIQEQMKLLGKRGFHQMMGDAQENLDAIGITSA